MHSTKNVQISKYFSSPREPQSVRSASSKTISLDLENQQKRIKSIISNVRKTDLASPNSITIGQSELQRIKNSTSVVTKEDLIQHRKMLEEQNERKLAAAKAKKQRMLEIEAEKKKSIPPSELEMEATMKNETLKGRAKELLNEEKDEVKHMNQMMLYAKVVTIRDRQLDEKQRLRNEFKNEEKRKDLMMEIDRLQKIKYYDEAERRLKDEQKKAAMETIVQIKERELERMKEQEEREREGQEMLKYIKQIQKEESEATLAKRHQQKQILDQIFESNQKAIARKHELVLQEREEEEKIVRYNVEKAQKDAEYQAELKRIKDEKEREIQRLRELQEKAFDRQAEIDAIRAKRASELADRQAREKERREAEIRSKLNHELLETRMFQSLEKERRLQEQARNDRDEFQKIIQNQKIERELEIRNEREKAHQMKDHVDQLKKQIAINEEKKKQEKRELLEEGKKIKDNLSHEKILLEAIKTQKLSELNSLGVASKYSSELARKRILI